MLKAKQILKIVLFVVLFLGTTAYVVYAMTYMHKGNPKEVCSEVSLIVEMNPHAPFINERSVVELLLAGNLYPEGRLMNEIDTRKIEQYLQQNQFVERVECYKTNNGMEVGKGKVCVRVTQRTPVIYVLPDGQQGYYVDGEGTIIPNTIYVKNIVTATGNINTVFATEELSTFGKFIRDHAYWDEQLEQVHVTLNAKKQRVVSLIPRRGDHTIFMGTLDNFEKKLRRLKIFYEKGLPQVGWNKYAALDLEYDNQIVCTKRK